VSGFSRTRTDAVWHRGREAVNRFPVLSTAQEVDV
jgi:hypothetical protein